MTPQLLQSYRFHALHSACIVGAHAAPGLSLARAELAASELEWSFEWLDDTDADLSWMSPEECEQDHTVEGCILRDASGNVLASLWGITDANYRYRRTVEAELALEGDASAALDAFDDEVVSGATAEAFA